MKITLLLDLDDTLLNSNMDEFIPAYFHALSDTLKDLVDPDIMIKGLMAGTKKMLGKTSLEGSLSEVFDGTFYKLIGIEKEELRSRLEYFYEDIFPSLGHLTSQKPEAIEFVEKSYQENHRIVIATNPIFPIKAVEHRLRWAGLPPDKYEYSLVTSFEDSHFTKENVAYFPEILGRLGWPEDPAIMIGNDLEMDIKPAIKAGFPAFWVTDTNNEGIQYDDIPKGNLVDFYPWLVTQKLENLGYSSLGMSALSNALSSTPAVLDGWLRTNGKYAQFKLNNHNTAVIEEAIEKLLKTETTHLKTLLQFFGSELDNHKDWKSSKLVSAQSEDQDMDSSLKKFTNNRQVLMDDIHEFDTNMGELNLRLGNDILDFMNHILASDVMVLRNTFKTLS